ncbi:hypothetical protein DAEQUDRAFT_333755 [Daedalea quercina L-15889]|uniref:C2H2-type domain-containing protein n=1 Tax=Daedalea quercina L-15889 TaxID=1314783 RepID=A0A165PMT3_9APHY|nr:hypothetical protein DAEQUDRAFT_333755 [Daedalea quercina L-15889]
MEVPPRSCATCGKCFKTDEGYQMHASVRGHAYVKSNPWAVDEALISRIRIKCDLCNVWIASEAKLKEHYRDSYLYKHYPRSAKHTPHEHPYCFLCAEGLRDALALTEHMEIVHDTVRCSCGVMVERHTWGRHFKESSFHFTCLTCGESFEHRAGLSEHINFTSHVQVPQGQIKKATQQRRSGDPGYLYPLSEDSQADRRGSAQCDITSRSTSSIDEACTEAERIKNERSVGMPHAQSRRQTKKAKIWRCDYCNIDFNKKKELKKHNLNMPLHPWCALCKLGCLSFQEYEMHMAQNHPVSDIQSPSLQSLPHHEPVSCIRGACQGGYIAAVRSLGPSCLCRHRRVR